MKIIIIFSNNKFLGGDGGRPKLNLKKRTVDEKEEGSDRDNIFGSRMKEEGTNYKFQENVDFKFVDQGY